MSSSRVREAWTIGSVCLFLLFLALSGVCPDPAKAVWDPKIATGAPRDPGTPFEEPEGGNPGDAQGGSARPASVQGGQRLTPAASLAPGAAKIVVRQLVLQRLVLILWHLQ